MNHRVVYLLGAGASVPAGLPTAMGLTDRAVKAANALGGFDLDHHARSLNFILAAMRLHDVRSTEIDPPAVGIERLVSAVELLAHRSDLEVAPFVQAWDPWVDALELGDSRSSVAARAFARSVLSVNEASIRRRQSILDQAAGHLEQAIRDFSRPTTTPAFGRLHAWLTRRLVMDLAVSDETDTYYLTPVPAAKFGVSFEKEAKDMLLRASGGYPYFIQEYGYAAWETAPEKVINVADAKIALEIGRQQLDQGFFPSRWEKATKAEKTFLRHMAADGEHGSSTSELADRAGKKQSSMTMTRSALINKGIIYAPSVGRVAFTLPGMAEYITRLNQE